MKLNTVVGPLRWLLVLSCLWAATGVWAQWPAGWLGAAGGTASAPAEAPAVRDWSRELHQLQPELQAWALAPAGPSAEERLRLAQRLVAQIESHLTPAAAPLAEPPVEQEPALMALGTEPPFSLTVLDSLRERRDALQQERGSLQLSLKLLESELTQALEARRRAEEQWRLHRERFERGQRGADAAELEARRDIARLTHWQTDLYAVQAVSARDAARARLEQVQVRWQAFERGIERASAEVVLAEAELQGMAETVEADARKVDQERERVEAEWSRARRSTEANADRIVESYQQRVTALTDLAAIERGKTDIWRYRQRQLSLPVEQRRSTVEALTTSVTQVTNRQRSAREQLERLRADIRSLDLQLERDADAPPGTRRLQQALLSQSLVQERVVEQLERTRVLLSFAQEDLGRLGRAVNARQWLDGARGWFGDTVLRFWRFELLNASEEMLVGGERVAIEYGVTVGKVLVGLLLVALGYAAASWATRRLMQWLVRRGTTTPQLARVLHRWFMSALVVLVVLVVLRLARVPLAAFAFLGGALAIGVGFGAQNVIKNLISGVIILFERKVRVDDIVTIGTVSGTVTSVDLRATTVRGFDGVESIFPNSMLLENPVSNWSYDNPVVRRTVTVGLAYGIDRGLAQQLILDSATAHLAVLPQPAPRVLLDDFGSDALVFRLYYWVRLGGALTGPEVDSALRFDMAQRLDAAGIVIAFPQRDVHLHTAAPLAVRWQAEPAP